MKKPKTVKGFLSLLLSVADTYVIDLKGYDKLTDEQEYELGTPIAQVQNMLGDECQPLLDRYGLNWKG